MADGLQPDIMGMPHFSTLVEEGRSGGYDVAFKDGIKPFNLKLQKKLIRHNAGELAYFMNSPYYRFHIYP